MIEIHKSINVRGDKLTIPIKQFRSMFEAAKELGLEEALACLNYGYLRRQEQRYRQKQRRKQGYNSNTEKKKSVLRGLGK